MGEKRQKAGQVCSECLVKKWELSLNPWGRTVQASVWIMEYQEMSVCANKKDVEVDIQEY